jgi:hypothetical protein
MRREHKKKLSKAELASVTSSRPVAEARHITDLSLEELAEVERVEAELG